MNNLGRIVEGLEEKGLEALLLTGEVSRHYASGFRSSAGVLLITREKSWYMTDSRYSEAAEAAIEGAEVITVGGEKGYHGLVRQFLGGRKTVGFEEGGVSCAAYEAWKKELGFDMVPAQSIVTNLRKSKSAAEVEKMIAAQEITDAVFSEILELLRPGISEKEISAELQYRQLKMGAEAMSFAPIVVSGPNTSLPHGTPGERRLKRGDFVTIDFGCIYEGYCSDMTRTVAIGEATKEMQSVYRIVLAAQQAGIEAFGAGIPGYAVDAAARQVIEAAGYGEYFGHGFGHSLGLEVHEEPNASPTGREPLPKGAVISAEPGIYLPGRFGVRIEDVVVVRDGGCTDITGSPKELIVL